MNMSQQGDSLMSQHEHQHFPVGMRVLVVDDDIFYLKMMDKRLLTTTKSAKEALRILNENNKFDIVITDVELPDMDGTKLLQHVALEMNKPVIVISAYNDTKRVMESVRNGACDYLVKPVEMKVLENIWQHVVRRNEFKMLKRSSFASVDIESTLDEISKDKSIEEISGRSDGKNVHEKEEDIGS